MIWLLVACGTAPEPETTAERVAHLIDDEAAARYPGLALDISDDGLIVARAGTRSTPLPMDELVVGCDVEPDACATRVAAVVEVAAASVGPHLGVVTADDAARLRPTTRSPAQLAELRGRLSESGADPDALVTGPFVGDLVFVVVIDRPNSQQVVLTAMLDTLGLDAAGAVTRAVAQLDATPVVALPADEVAPGVRMVFTDDGYGAARLAHPDAWRGLGDPVIVTPVTRDLVLVAPGDDPTALAAMQAVAERAAATDAIGIGWVPLRLASDGWTPLAR